MLYCGWPGTLRLEKAADTSDNASSVGESRDAGVLYASTGEVGHGNLFIGSSSGYYTCYDLSDFRPLGIRIDNARFDRVVQFPVGCAL